MFLPLVCLCPCFFRSAYYCTIMLVCLSHLNKDYLLTNPERWPPEWRATARQTLDKKELN